MCVCTPSALNPDGICPGENNVGKSLSGYLRKGVFPDIFCPGCGHGILMGAILRAIQSMELEKDDLLFVSGIGCGGWIPNPHFAMDAMHVTHGRAIPFAIGAKAFNPDLNVIVISGDGDLASIGGNHLIHAARKNIDITVICADNQIYGMTGGQVSPLTPVSWSTSTTRSGNREKPFDLCRLVRAAGGGYVARFPVTDRAALLDSLIKAIQTPGFSFVDVISPCSTDIKRRYFDMTPYESMMRLKERFLPIDAIIKGDESDESMETIITGEY